MRNLSKHNMNFSADQNHGVQLGSNHGQMNNNFYSSRSDEQLPYAAGAAWNDHHRRHDPLCSEGTRVQLLEEIKTWTETAQTTHIYWLRGMAGTGKSTISRTIARDLHESHPSGGSCRLGGSFFFSRGDGDRARTTKLITTLARQLATLSPALRTHIRNSFDRNPDIVWQTSRNQWRNLILQPLSCVDGRELNSGPILFVLDALDECDKEDDIHQILQIFATERFHGSIRLLFFVTSRPETDVQGGFNKIEGYHKFVLHNIEESIVEQDIMVFIRDRFNDTRKSQGLPPTWPGEEQISCLARKAEGLFIYAATACRFVDKYLNAQEGLEIILRADHTIEKSPELNLDRIYTAILQRLTKIQGYSTQQEMIQRVLAAITTLAEPLSLHRLVEFLDVEFVKVQSFLRHLQSVIDVPNLTMGSHSSVKVLHTSFRDFLQDGNRCTDERFHVNEKETHQLLVRNCIRIMSQALRKDMCHLQDPGVQNSSVDQALVDEHIPGHLKYACRYWVKHLERYSNKRDATSIHNSSNKLAGCISWFWGKHLKRSSNALDTKPIYGFLRNHFLHWLEALSLEGKTHEAVHVLTELQSLSKPDHNLKRFVYDAHRFTLAFRSVIEEAPLQTYISALLFAPRRSIVRQQFSKEIPQWVVGAPQVEEEWSPVVQVLRGHSSYVYAVAFSPDGDVVASGSSDKTVKLWDAKTGQLRTTLEGHSGWVQAVAFSPDGGVLFAIFYDGTDQAWNVKTGDLVDVTYPSALTPSSSTTGSLSIQDHWLTSSRRKVILLPLDSSPSSFASCGNSIAVGLPSGRVFLLSLDPQEEGWELGDPAVSK